MEFRQTSLLTGSHARSRGFSLVVSLSVMAMLVLIMITLFSLLGTAIRSADIAKARTEAQANARMSMMLALGELQQLAGLDTRITAGSDFDIVSGSNVRATGVWRSWEGTDRDEDGLPIAPDYTLKSEAGDSNSPLGVTGDDPEGRFLGWLASPMSGLEPDAQTLNGLSSTPSPGSVPLVASGSVEDAAEHVHATTTRVEGAEKQGTYAWWISGDNQKAMLNVDPVDPPDSTVDWHTRMKSNGRADPEYFGLEELDELPKPAPVPNTASFNLIDTSNVDMRKFHDFTAFNRGLLTNSANGGWRRDLSLFSENYSDLPDTSLPSLTLKPGQIQTSSKAAEQGA
ncbi:MAG: type IV pilus modification PilV family protein, partial [Opitutales bacterium]